MSIKGILLVMRKNSLFQKGVTNNKKGSICLLIYLKIIIKDDYSMRPCEYNKIRVLLHKFTFTLLHTLIFI